MISWKHIIFNRIIVFLFITYKQNKNNIIDHLTYLYLVLAMSSSEKNNCSQCQNKKRIKFNNSKKRQPTTSFTANNVDYNTPSTSTAQYDRPSSADDVSCVNIR